ncbi:hypothetical protein K8354_09220 [Polaribacter litorisediminis]|uniref:hypothetical protein n=1 Tax=Polaribacter litorisediminis TaxID=1908341 RepID=UPI001CBDE4E7|nr:hypothetical protein [Polaribacter litorisediminis]UAM99959.1 hypothetical protein K8354_09220 [Polaribacter litorisediminis]
MKSIQLLIENYHIQQKTDNLIKFSNIEKLKNQIRESKKLLDSLRENIITTQDELFKASIADKKNLQSIVNPLLLFHLCPSFLS